MARGRKSETTEFTTRIAEALVNAGIFTEVNISGNTLAISVDGDLGFKFTPRPLSGITLGVSKFSAMDCILQIRRFISETGIYSSTKYNTWVKKQIESNNDLKKIIPTTHAVTATLGVWPGRSILKAMLTGKDFENADENFATEIVDIQKALDAEA